MKESKFWLICFVAAMLLATALRFQGLEFGSPSHGSRPDEEYVIHEAIFLNVGGPIEFHRYPPALIYFTAATYKLGAMIGALPEDPVRGYVNNPMPFHVWARALNTLLALLTIMVVGLTAKKLMDWKSATFAVLTIGTFPLHALHSHFATVDTPATLFLALCIHFALTSRAEKDWHLIASGFLAGAAAASKYPVGMIALTPLLLAFKSNNRWRTVSFVCLATAVGMLILAPTWLSSTKEVLEGLSEESRSQEDRRAMYSFVEVVSHHFRITLCSGYGLTLFCLAASGLTWAISKERRHGAILPFLFAITIFNLALGVPFARYFLPLAPILALGIGFLVFHSKGKFEKLALLLVVFFVSWNSFAAARMSLKLALKSTEGELLEAFEDGRLPRDLKIIRPDWPFKVFPHATVIKANARMDLPKPQLNFREIYYWEILQELKDDKNHLDVLMMNSSNYAEINFEQLLAKEDLLYIEPQTPRFGAAWLRYNFQNEEVSPKLRQLAAAKKITLTELIDIDPRLSGEFPEPSHFEGPDYWFLPIGRPDLVKRPGPRIRVYRISAVR